jgi:hypothetical protein
MLLVAPLPVAGMGCPMFNALRIFLRQWLGVAPPAPDRHAQIKDDANEKTIGKDSATDDPASSSVVHSEPVDGYAVPYDENLLERARTQWQFGDWSSLCAIGRESLQHHPDRAKLALLVGAAHMQEKHTDIARQFIRLAQDWGCGKRLISQVLVSGVHNSLGRAAAICGQTLRAQHHFEDAIALGAPGNEVRLLAHARSNEQLTQLGLSSGQVPTQNITLPPVPGLPPLSQSMQALGEIITAQKADLDQRLTKQANDLISVRKFLDSSIRKEVTNATKQLEAFLGIQNYFNTGTLPDLSTETHTWPISPDFALYMMELLELHSYDMVIEFGSGVSTVLIAKTQAQMVSRKPGQPAMVQVAFEHLEQFHSQTLASLTLANLAQNVQLLHTPLEPWLAANGQTYSFYSCNEVLASLASQYQPHGLRILVLIDGPPSNAGKHARYPAAPIVLTHFASAHVDLLLDDFVREEEQEIARRWQEELTANGRKFTTTTRKLEKNACLISIEPKVKS